MMLILPGAVASSNQISGGLPTLSSGFTFVVDSSGNYVVYPNGDYVIVRVV